MRILLTGANGFVGARIREAMPVIAAPSLRGATLEDIQKLIDSVQPDAIIHTAAISDIGDCEKDPEGSWHANVMVPEYLARAAQGAKLAMFSSDQVYSGCEGDGPYAEDEVNPANTYARHKLEMEHRVLEINPDAVLLRATWMYDMPMFGVSNRGNFLMNVLRAAAEGKPVSFSGTEYRAVTYVREVAEKTREVLSVPGGVYNFGSENDVPMREVAEFLSKELRLNIQIEDRPKHHNLWMNCDKLRAQGVSFSNTIDGLKKCIADYSL